MNVLIACEESQVECCAFRAAGHNAFSCDLQECSGGHPEWHIQGDALALLSRDLSFTTCDGVSHYIDQWDLIIAHPPCTFLSKAGSTRLYPVPGCLDYQRYLKGLDGKAFFEAFLTTTCCSRIAVENPVPLSVFGLPPYQQIVEPWQFDLDGSEPYQKATCLWLVGLPLLIPRIVINPLMLFPGFLVVPFLLLVNACFLAYITVLKCVPSPFEALLKLWRISGAILAPLISTYFGGNDLWMVIFVHRPLK